LFHQPSLRRCLLFGDVREQPVYLSVWVSGTGQWDLCTNLYRGPGLLYLRR